MKGRIWLLPVTLGGNNYEDVIPLKALEVTRRLRYFIVEDIRSARRYLRLIDKEFPIDDSCFYVLNKYTPENEISSYLKPLIDGNDIGLMSEAGLPGIADPGAKVVAEAHRKGFVITPLSGPSSIILALIASGMNGQNFTFNGYLPVKAAERTLKLRELEKRANEGFSQIFMETPYRNKSMLESILEVCNQDRLLCIAADITLPSEYIKTMRIGEWKKKIPDLRKKPVIFIIH